MNKVNFDRNFLKQLISEQIEDYALSKIQSQKIDDYLGYRVFESESLLKKNKESDQNFWIGLDADVLQTPYYEIFKMLDFAEIKENETVIDLGSAYGRMGIVMALFYSKSFFVGYEYLGERVNQGNQVFVKYNFENSVQKQIDLASESFTLPDSDLYFIYDFGSKKDVYIVLEKLRIISKNKKIRVIARGGGIRNWIMQDFPWLSQFNHYDRFDHWTLFRT